MDTRCKSTCAGTSRLINEGKGKSGRDERYVVYYEKGGSSESYYYYVLYMWSYMYIHAYMYNPE